MNQTSRPADQLNSNNQEQNHKNKHLNQTDLDANAGNHDNINNNYHNGSIITIAKRCTSVNLINNQIIITATNNINNNEPKSTIITNLSNKKTTNHHYEYVVPWITKQMLSSTDLCSNI